MQRFASAANHANNHKAAATLVKDGAEDGGSGRWISDPEVALSNLRCSTDYDLLDEAEFVIECATEKWEIKRTIYMLLDEVCPSDCCFGVNTSAIPITQVASLTRRPARVVGMHFMNPVPRKSTVELIQGFHTSEETIALAQTLLRQMNKRGVLVQDSPGFVSNRVLMLMINEAFFLLHERVADAGNIDDIFRSCFGHTMGPLQTADLIGLDTILYSLDVLYEQLRDPKFRPCPLLKRLVDAGQHGRKSGVGVYSYQ